MLEIIFPRIEDKASPGHRVALVLFGVLLALTIAMSANCVLNGRRVLVSADGIPE